MGSGVREALRGLTLRGRAFLAAGITSVAEAGIDRPIVSQPYYNAMNRMPEVEHLPVDAEELLLDAQLRRGRARMVLPRAHDMVRAAPLRERRWELLALAQYRTGAQGEALRTGVATATAPTR